MKARKEVDEYVKQMAVFVHSGIKKLYSHLIRTKDKVNCLKNS